MAGPVATDIWGRGGRRARYVVDACRFDDVRYGHHVLHDPAGTGAGFEPVHLARLAQLHAQPCHAGHAGDLCRNFRLLFDRVAHYSHGRCAIRAQPGGVFRLCSGVWRHCRPHFFIHHIALSIQASSIIASVAQETNASIDRLFPEKREPGPDNAGGEENGQLLPSLDERTWYAVPAEVSGYIQSVDHDAILRLARDRRTIVRMEHGIGAFVVQDAVLVSLALTYPPDQETIVALNGAYGIGRHRTADQDPSFGIRQVVDIALKALSPGVNDTSTAVMCVDYLTAILARLACRQFPPSHRYEGETLRVIAIVPTFEGLLAEAFDQIRGSAAGNVAIMARMLGAIDTIASLTVSPSHLRALDEQVQWIADLADRSIESTHDRARIERRLMQVREALVSETALRAVEEKA